MHRKMVAAAAMLLISSGAAGRAQTPRAVATSDATTVDAYLEREMQARRIRGLALAVVDHGTIVLERAYGIANLETDTPMTPSSIFELSSVTASTTTNCRRWFGGISRGSSGR